MPGAFSDWSAADSALLASTLGAIYADIDSTKGVLKRGGTETNPAFGTEHPSGAALDQAGLIGGGLTTLGAAYLDPKWRRTLLAGITGLEGALAYQNSHLDTKESKKDFKETIGKPIAIGALFALLASSTLSDASSSITPYASPHEAGLAYTRKF